MTAQTNYTKPVNRPAYPANSFQRARSLTVKMDKKFDFKPFLDKELKHPEDGNIEVSQVNVIKDETYKKGLLKTLIIAGNGSFEIVDSKYGFSIKNGSAGYEALGDAYPYLAPGMFITNNDCDKLPRKAIETVIEWYRRITEKNGQEAQVNFYYNSNNIEEITVGEGAQAETIKIKDIPGVHFWTDKLFSYTPLQNNSGTLTSVDSRDKYYDEFNRVLGMYIETHSHNSMDAFASGTDEENSANDGFQLVFGHLNTNTPIMYSWATMNHVLKLGLSHDDLTKIMDLQPNSVYNENTEKVSYNANELEFDESLFEEWDKQVVQRVYATTPYSSYGNYGGSHWDDWDSYSLRTYNPYNTAGNYAHQRGYTSHKQSTYKPASIIPEMDFVADTFTQTWNQYQASFFIHDQSVCELTMSELFDIIKDAYLMAYDTKRATPYKNMMNEDTIEMNIQNDVETIMDTLQALPLLGEDSSDESI